MWVAKWGGSRLVPGHPAEQWRWSSFRWLVLGKRDGPLRVNEWDETIPESKPNSTRLNGETCGTQN